MATDAEIRKRFTQKVGYENALDFDPVSGVIKFGSYEAFAKDLLKPIKRQVSLTDYVRAGSVNNNNGPFGSAALSGVLFESRKKEFLKNFENDVYSKKLKLTPKPEGPLSQNAQPGLFIDNYRTTILSPERPDNLFRSVKRIDDETFEIEDYVVPNDQVKGYELLTEISRRAAGLSKSVQVNRNNDALRQNQQDAAARRQGRASTVLSGINT